MMADREICALITAIFFFLIPSVPYPTNLFLIIPLVILFPGYLFIASLEKGILEKVGLGAFLSIVVNSIGLTALAYFSMFTFPRVMVYLGGIAAILYVFGVALKWEGEKIKFRIEKGERKILAILLPAIIIASTYAYFATNNVNYNQGYFEFYMENLPNLSENESYGVHITVVNHYDISKNITVKFSITLNNTTIFEDEFQKSIKPNEKIVKKYVFVAINNEILSAELYSDGKFYGRIHQRVQVE